MNPKSGSVNYKIETDLKRSLDRLEGMLAQKKVSIKELGTIVPAFYYSTKLLLEYSTSFEYANQNYFSQFKKLTDELGRTYQLAEISITQQYIIDNIFYIVSSPRFLDNLRPDIKLIRNSQKIKYYNIVLRARDDYQFTLEKDIVEYGLMLSSLGLYSKILPTPSISLMLSYQDELWYSALRNYEEHSLDEAARMVYYYKKNLNRITIPYDRLKLINIIELYYATMTHFYSYFYLEGWEFDRKDNGITLYYKMYKQEKQIAIRISGEFYVDIEPFLAIISEIDLMGEYVPFCYDSRYLKNISRNYKIGTSKIYIPLLTDRETYFYAAGYDRFKSKRSIFFFSKTINEDVLYHYKYNFKVPYQSEYVRLDYKFFIIEYRPLNKHRAFIRLASKVDLQMNFLPYFILFRSARYFAFYYFKNILDRAKNFKGSKWEYRMLINPDLYLFFRRKINEYLQY